MGAQMQYPITLGLLTEVLLTRLAAQHHPGIEQVGEALCGTERERLAHSMRLWNRTLR